MIEKPTTLDAFQRVVLDKLDRTAEKVDVVERAVASMATNLAVTVERGATDRAEITELRKKTDFLMGKIAGMSVAVGTCSVLLVEWLKGLLPHK